MKIINMAIVFWVGMIVGLYCYYNEYFYEIFSFSLIIFIFLSLLIFFNGGKTKITKEVFQKKIKKYFNNSYEIDFLKLLLIFPLVAVFCANAAVLYIPYYKVIFVFFNGLADKTSDFIGLSAINIAFSFMTIFPVFASVGFLLFLKKYGKNLFAFLKTSIIFLSETRRLVLFSASIVIFLVFFNYLQLEKFLSGLGLFGAIILSELSIFKKIYTMVLFCFFVLWLAYSLGKTIIKIFNLKIESGHEFFVFSVGLGFIPFMFMFFIVALKGWFFPWVIWLIVFFAFILSKPLNTLKEIKKLKIKLLFNDFFSSVKSLVLILLFTVTTLYFITIFKPVPTDLDSLHTYFNAPNLFSTYHKYIPLKHFGGANMGQNTEILYAGIISTLGSPYASHFQFLFFILCLITFYHFLRKLFGEKYALTGLFFMFFVGWNHYFINTLKVEFFLSFYSLLSICLLFLWTKENKSAYLYLMGIFSGISLGIKYNAALLIAPLYLFAAFTCLKSRKEPGKKIKTVFISLMFLFIFFSPWAIKNKIYFDNFFFPFKDFGKISKNEVYIQESKAYEKYKQERNAEVIDLKYAAKKTGSAANFIKYFLDNSIKKDVLKRNKLDFGFAILIILPFFFLFFRDKRLLSLALISIVYFSLFFAVSTLRPWYFFFGIIMVYALLPHIVLRDKSILFILFLYMLLTQPFIFVNILKESSNNIEYLAGRLNKNDYLEKSIFYYGAAKYINNLKLDSDLKILVLGETMGALIDDNDKILLLDPYLAKIGYLLNNQSEKTAAKSLVSEKIKYILLRKEDLNLAWLANKGLALESYKYNYQGKTASIYGDKEKIDSFLKKQTTVVFADKYYTLNEINE